MRKRQVLLQLAARKAVNAQKLSEFHCPVNKLTSSKNTLAMCRYSGDLKAKSTLKNSHVEPGVGPGLNSQVESR